MFRPLQVHHQGGMYKGTQVEEILSKMRVCSEKMQNCYILIIKPTRSTNV